MRDEGRESCLRVLGLKPGASAQEIKAAYRDLAKVWHPDRFGHDPRLQQKAQEQLKEINEAYQRLLAGDHEEPNARARREPRASYEPRAAQPPPRPTGTRAANDDPPGARTAATTDERVATRPRRNVTRIALAAPALAFCATFALVTPRLLSNGRAPEQPGDTLSVAAPARDEHGEPTTRPEGPSVGIAQEIDGRAQQKNQTAARPLSTQAADTATTAPSSQPVRPLATVTVSIDPTTGLRARAACPNKSPMTFPAGDAPSAYCDAAHNTASQQRPAADEARASERDESRLKSLANRVASPAKKLFGGRRAPDKEPARGTDAVPHN